MADHEIIILIGDSVLDNFYWLSDKTCDLKRELNNLGFIVNNYAVDQAKLQNITQGIIPRNVYQNARLYPYPVDKDGKVYPLHLLSTECKKNNNDMVVLCIGGNDLRRGLKEVIFGVDVLFNTIFTKEYISNYEYVINEIKQKTSKWNHGSSSGRNCVSFNKLLLVSVYCPYMGSDSSYRKYDGMIEPLIVRWREFLQNLAYKYNIPVLDLSRTFNNQNRQHYGSTVIEPSNLSNKCMADCISYIYKNYNGYHIYFAPNCDNSNMQII